MKSRHWSMTGMIWSAIPLFLYFLNLLTPSETDIFYFLLCIVVFPTTLLRAIFFPGFHPYPPFWIVGMGDVFGFVYVFDIFTTVIFFFGLGVLYHKLIFPTIRH